MRLKHLTIAGFRGFNTPRTIDFHNQLTLISAPNSHGKTSIIEALEFLFYGQTSKVEYADSKDEFKDSYENRHYPHGEAAYIEAYCLDETQKGVTLRVEIDEQGTRRFVDGQAVTSWPFEAALSASARPFVVQHALKSLLLAAPSERFQGFARLLGLREVDSLQQALVNLCTKPEAQIPREARHLLEALEVFVGRLRGIKETVPIAKALEAGGAGVKDAFAKLRSRGIALLGKEVSEDALSTELVSLRNAAAAKVYAGSVAIKTNTVLENQRLAAARERIDRAMSATTLESYSRIAVGDSADRLRKEAEMLGLGIALLTESPDSCPFCGQTLVEPFREGIHTRHKHLVAAIGSSPDLHTARAQMAAAMKDLAGSLGSHFAILTGRSSDLLNANSKEASQQIKALFGKGNEHSLLLIASAGAAISPTYRALTQSQSKASAAIAVCDEALKGKTESVAQIEALISTLAEYVKSSESYTASLEGIAPTLAEPTQILQKAVDDRAGTAELSLLIEVLGSRVDIQRAVKIEQTLAGLKDLKKHVDQAVGQTMEQAFSGDLTGAVMKWYKRIRTTGDPDVHFSGFAMERTKSGDFKNRRVRVSAHSYGVELASAVSSLSESKLNALGLCMSIATALRAPGPWDFLILDDPIQSWDDDHEIQFVSVIRSLAEEEGRQIVLMSHRDGWIDQVVAGCRSINGTRYHITGYTQDGPAIQPIAWASLDQRLKEALTIAKDPTATAVRLQQAEEEIRIAACQLTAEVSRVRLNRLTGAHSMNSDKARSILNESGCPASLVDRVIASFATTDPAHHAPKDYVPNAERVRQYHGTLTELSAWLKNN
jgi:AAA domain